MVTKVEFYFFLLLLFIMMNYNPIIQYRTFLIVCLLGLIRFKFSIVIHLPRRKSSIMTPLRRSISIGSLDEVGPKCKMHTGCKSERRTIWSFKVSILNVGYKNRQVSHLPSHQLKIQKCHSIYKEFQMNICLLNIHGFR